MSPRSTKSPTTARYKPQSLSSSILRKFTLPQKSNTLWCLLMPLAYSSNPSNGLFIKIWMFCVVVVICQVHMPSPVWEVSCRAPLYKTFLSYRPNLDLNAFCDVGTVSPLLSHSRNWSSQNEPGLVELIWKPIDPGIVLSNLCEACKI